MKISLEKHLPLILVLVLLLSPAGSGAAAVPQLSAPPLGERWLSVSMGEERVGFVHQEIAPASGGYLISSEGSVKMGGMGFSRDANSRECYLVGPDLAIRSFTVDQTIGGSRSLVIGVATAKGLKVAIEKGGKKKEKLLSAKGPVYPPSALNLVPLMRHGKGKEKVKLAVLDPEAVKLKQVTVNVVGTEVLNGRETVHLKNNNYPVVDNDVWVDLQGNTVRESVSDDLVVTSAEDAKSARSNLAEAALARKDRVLEFSRIQVQPAIADPAKLTRLTLDLSGVPESMPLLQGARQQAKRLADGTTRFTMEAAAPSLTPPGTAEAKPAGETTDRPISTNLPLGPTPPPLKGEGRGEDGVRCPAADTHPPPFLPLEGGGTSGGRSALIGTDNDPEMAGVSGEIVGKEEDPARKAGLLVAWVSKRIEASVNDRETPRETLQSGNGNSQAHTRLFAALACAAGIPTRLVSGVVYAPGLGFLYHSWAESYLNGWVPVDPTFGQYPADLTHIKLAEGETPDEIGILAGVIGKVQAKALEQIY